MSIGYKIRLLREKHGLKQINLANVLQVSPQAVSKWERGANCPDMAQLVKIARLFNASADYLLGITKAENGVFEASVLCSGIAGFARRSVSMNAHDLAAHINGIFYHLTESALKFDGIPVKYVGDGFLCFFSGPDHADRAIEAAVHGKRVVDREDLAMAIHTGDIYLGLVGHPNYAMRDIMGETVNRAFLMLEWIIKHSRSRVGASDRTIAAAVKPLKAELHGNVVIDLMGEMADVYDIL